MKMLTNDYNDETDKRFRDKLVRICDDLDIKESDMNLSWENYRTARNDYILEVSTSSMHFLCCREIFN